MQNKTHFADVQAGSVEAVIRDGSRAGRIRANMVLSRSARSKHIGH